MSSSVTTMHPPSDRTPEHSASPSPELCGLLSEDKDVEMIDSEAESQEPAAGSAHARSAPPRLGVAQATVHGRLNELDTQHNFNSDEEGGKGGEGQGQGQVQEDEEDKGGQLDIPREPRSRSRSRLDGDSKPSSRPVTTPAHAPLGNERSVPSSIPKVKIEYDRGLNKEANRRLDQSSLLDRHRCTAESLADSDELSTRADARGERDRAWEISMNLVTDTEAATVEFLFPSRGGDAASGYSDACKLRVTTKGSGSVSLSASWRVG